MTIEGFNPEAFSNDMMMQVLEVIPKDLDEKDAKFVIDAVCKSCKISAQNICDDNLSRLDKDKAKILVQLVSEWIFHKAIDMTRANVDLSLRSYVLTPIAIAVFEISKREMNNQTPLEKILKEVEQKASVIYAQGLEKLYKSNKIDRNIFQNALEQSNIDKMSLQIERQKNPFPFEHLKKTVTTMLKLLKE